MQNVHAAHGALFKRDIALKTPKEGVTLARFEKSAVMSARVNHVNVVKTLDYVEHDGAPYLIEELVVSEDFSKFFPKDGSNHASRRHANATNPPPPLPAFIPVSRKTNRHDGWTPERQRAFIEVLAEHWLRQPGGGTSEYGAGELLYAAARAWGGELSRGRGGMRRSILV